MFRNDDDLFVDDGSTLMTAVTEHLAFEIKKRGVRIPVDYMIHSRGETADYLAYAKKTYCVPDDAKGEIEQDSRLDGQVYVYKWEALDLDQDMYEKLFDHPAFEPV